MVFVRNRAKPFGGLHPRLVLVVSLCGAVIGAFICVWAGRAVYANFSGHQAHAEAEKYTQWENETYSEEPYDEANDPLNKGVYMRGSYWPKDPVNFPEVTDFGLMWAPQRTAEQLSAEKHSPSDIALETVPLPHPGHRFSFLPKDIDVAALNSSKRISLKFEIDAIIGNTQTQVLVQVVEKVDGKVPFKQFWYKNIMSLPSKGFPNRTVDVPIPLDFMNRWISQPNEPVKFMLMLEYGFMSTVRLVYVTRPLIVISSTPRPRCVRHHTCCLIPMIETFRGEFYENRLLAPLGVQMNKCIDCMNASDKHKGDLSSINLVLAGRIKPADYPKPKQFGKCRGSRWDGTDFVHMLPEWNEELNKTRPEVYVSHFPYTMATECECVDEDYDADYVVQQLNADIQARFDADETYTNQTLEYNKIRAARGRYSTTPSTTP